MFALFPRVAGAAAAGLAAGAVVRQHLAHATDARPALLPAAKLNQPEGVAQSLTHWQMVLIAGVQSRMQYE